MVVEATSKFSKDLDKLTKLTKVQEAVYLAIKNMQAAKTISEIKNITKMEGYKNCYRIKIGYYRIGIKITKNIVELGRVAHRSKIYQIFP